MSAKKVALEAARLIREVGWCQGAFRQKDAEGKEIAYCINGALKRAADVFDGNLNKWALFSTTRDLIDALIPTLDPEWKGDPGMVNYNDAKGRTRDEVISLLERAAEKLP